MTLAPHELRLGRLLMVAFLLIFLHRVLTIALTARGGRHALPALEAILSGFGRHRPTATGG